MILGSKPLAEMSEEEMQAAIIELQSKREALRAEAIATKAKRDAGIKEPKAPKVPKVVDPLAADMLAFLKGEKDDM